MAERRLGLIMHGVTGRMGYNQHLVRSILAIREQGGVALANGDRLDRSTRSSSAATATRSSGWPKSTRSSAGRPISTKCFPTPRTTVFFDAGTTQMRAELLSRAIDAGKHVYCEKPVSDDLESPSPGEEGQGLGRQAWRGAGQAVPARAC
jgi:predicted dehydrogenase